MTFGHGLHHSERRSHRRRSPVVLAAVGAALLLALAACATAPAIALGVDSSSAQLLRGGDVAIEVSLTRIGSATGDVGLSVTGLPANVNAVFSPVTLSGGTLTSTLTLTAEAAASEGSYDLSVVGTGAGVADSAELVLEVVSLSVTGRVMAGFGLPVGGVSVRSQGDFDVTDLEGYFDLDGLSVPYDVSVWSTTEEWLNVFEGLTAENPVLAPLVAEPLMPTARSTTVTGLLSGGVIPVAANQNVIVCIEGLDGLVLGCDIVIATENAYSLGAEWYGPATREVRVHALQVEFDGDGYPVSYQGYANVDTTLTDGFAQVADLDLGDALETTTVTVDIDAAGVPISLMSAVELGPDFAMRNAIVPITDLTHEMVMPVIDGASYRFASLIDLEHMGWSVGVTEATATVTIPAAPQLVAPADLTTGVTNATSFTAFNPSGGPMTFMWDADVGNLQVLVTTMESTTSIPDLAEYGLALPAGADFGWQVIGSSGAGSESGARFILDYYGVYVGFLLGSSFGLESDGSLAISAAREFTTAP